MDESEHPVDQARAAEAESRAAREARAEGGLPEGGLGPDEDLVPAASAPATDGGTAAAEDTPEPDAAGSAGGTGTERGIGPDQALAATPSDGAPTTNGPARSEDESSVHGERAAKRIDIVQGRAQYVEADEVHVQFGGVGRAEAEAVSVSQGGIGIARADRVSVRFGGVGAALAGTVEIRQALSRFVAARGDVRLDQSGAVAVVANRVDMTPQSGAVFVFAREVNGQVRTLFDWRVGVAFGLGLGVVTGLLRAVSRRAR